MPSAPSTKVSQVLESSHSAPPRCFLFPDRVRSFRETWRSSSSSVTSPTYSSSESAMLAGGVPDRMGGRRLRAQSESRGIVSGEEGPSSPTGLRWLEKRLRIVHSPGLVLARPLKGILGPARSENTRISSPTVAVVSLTPRCGGEDPLRRRDALHLRSVTESLSAPPSPPPLSSPLCPLASLDSVFVPEYPCLRPGSILKLFPFDTAPLKLA